MTKKKETKKPKKLPIKKVVKKVEEPLEIIKGKQVGKNLIVVVGKTRYTKLIESEAWLKSISNKLKIYEKKPTKALKETIIGLIDTVKKQKEKSEAVIKGAKTGLKKIAKGVKKEVKEKKKVTKKKLDTVKEEAKMSVKITQEQLDMLVMSNDGTTLAMKGTEDIPMPELLVKKIQEFVKAGESLQALLNFWSLCLLNPNEVARTKLFDYLSRQNLTITPSGYFVTYRMVKKTDKPKVFKSNHANPDGTELFYEEGTVVRIPREECDEDGRQDCSRGLHTGTPKFIGIVAEKKQNIEEGKGTVGDGYGIKYVTTKKATPDSYGTGYDSAETKGDKTETQTFDQSFGNQAIICLINPSHVVSIPDSDTRKMRSCEFYFAKCTTAEEVIDMIEKDYLIYDFDYQKIEFKQLQEMLKGTTLKKYIDVEDINNKREIEFRSIVDNELSKLKLSNDKINSKLSSNEIKNIIKQRLITVNGRK